MSSDKVMEMQHHIRRNASDLQNYLVELADWEKEIKKKDQELKRKHEESKVCNNKKETNTFQEVHSQIRRDQHREKNAPITADKSTNPMQQDVKLGNTAESEEKEKSLSMKNQGNDHFKNGNFEAAIRCYTSGLDHDPKNPVLLANRAMAYLKTKEPELAEKDCTKCLLYDSSYVKAFHRRGIARTMLRRFHEAKADFKEVLKLDPSNKQAVLEIQRIEKDLQCPPILIPGDTDKPSITAEPSASQIPQSKVTSMRCPLHNSDVEENFIKLPIKISNPIEQQKIGTPSGDSKPLDDVGVTLSPPMLPEVPEKGFQFLVDWVALRAFPDLQYQYLKQFNPENFPALFKFSMEAELFSEILKVLHKFFIRNSENVYQYLKCLTKIGRFQTLLMLLSEEEQLGVKELLAYVEKETMDNEKMETLWKEYGHVH